MFALMLVNIFSALQALFLPIRHRFIKFYMLGILAFFNFLWIQGNITADDGSKFVGPAVFTGLTGLVSAAAWLYAGLTHAKGKGTEN
ncbi:MAG TPA: hypothetical protein VGE45_01605 [Chloroflexia bacterium]|jgi:hypothetical protein